MTARRPWTRALIYVVLIVFAVYYLMPVYVLVITGLKTQTEVNVEYMWQLPQGLHFDGFNAAWPKVSANFINSIIITVPAVIISSIIGSMNGYIFAKWRFRHSDTIFLLVLVGMFLPYQGILIPLVQTLMAIGLYAKVGGVIFVHCVFGIPIGAMMFRSYFAGVPNELLDAGKIDGCGFFGIYRHLMLPIAFPAFAVVLIWQFTNIWNDYIIGLVVLSNPRLAPVNVAVQNLAGTYTTQWQVQMSGALIAALPTIFVYLALGRFFMRGLLAGSVKG
jgi:glucose/mannose transport system permease protein